MPAEISISIRLKDQASGGARQVTRALSDLKAENLAAARAFDQAEKALKSTDKQFLQAQRSAQALVASEIRAANAAGDYGLALALVQRELSGAQAGTVRYNDLLATQSRLMRKVEQDAGGVVTSTGGLQDSLVGAAKGYIGLQAVQQTLEWAKQGAAIQDVRTSFDKLAASAGTTSTALLAEMKKASKGTISDAELMVTANQAVLLSQGRFATELPRLLAGARASAKATGKDVSGALNDIISASARGSTELADNLGFVVNTQEAYKKYADSIGVSVDALDAQQRQTAFTNELLNQTDKLVLTLGDDTANSADKIARGEAAWKNFTDTLKVFAGEGLAGAADGISYLQQIMDGNGSGDKQAQAIAQTAQTYEQYVAALKSGDQTFKTSTANMQGWAAQFGPLGSVLSFAAGVQRGLVGETEILSRAQFDASQQLQQFGFSAEQASKMVQGLSGQQTILAAATGALRRETTLGVEAKTALVAQMIQLATTSPQLAVQMAGLVQQFVMGKISGQELQGQIALMAAEQGGATQATIDLANALILKNNAAAGATGALWDMNDATYQQEVASLKAAIAAEQQSRFQDDLARTAMLVASGSENAAAAEAYLARMYNLNADEVANLVALTNELNKTRGGQQGNALAGAAAAQARRITEGQGGARGYDARSRSYDRWQEAQRTPPKGRSGGTGKTDAERAAEQAQRAQEQEAEARQKALYDLMSDEQKLAEQRRRAMDMRLPESERLEALKEIEQLESKIADQRDRARRADLDAQKGRVSDTKARLVEDQEIERARRVLASDKTSAAQKAAAQARIDEIAIDRQIRAEDIAQNQREAGMAPVLAGLGGSGGDPRRTIGGGNAFRPFDEPMRMDIPQRVVGGSAFPSNTAGAAGSLPVINLTVPLTVLLDKKQISGELVPDAVNAVGVELRLAAEMIQAGGSR